MASVRRASIGLIAAATATFATAAFAQAEPKPVEIDAADTAWMITATALVLMTSIPGLALFYAGMVRKKNVLATMVRTFAAVSLGSIVWLAVGATLAWSGVVTLVLLKVINLLVPLRVRDEDERAGLDLALHGEALQ